MACVIGYVRTKSANSNTSQFYGVLRRILPSNRVKYGTFFNYRPVIWMIPSGYVRDAVYIKQAQDDLSSTSYYLYFGACTYETAGDRVETVQYTNNEFDACVIAYDNGEMIAVGDVTLFALELLDTGTLTPKGFMFWQSEDNEGLFIDGSSIVRGQVTAIINPTPVRTGDKMKIGRVYFLTPLGLVTTRRLYGGYTGSARITSAVTLGDKKLIPVGSYLVDVTGEI